MLLLKKYINITNKKTFSILSLRKTLFEWCKVLIYLFVTSKIFRLEAGSGCFGAARVEQGHSRALPALVT